jgi:hypothetical protein
MNIIINSYNSGERGNIPIRTAVFGFAEKNSPDSIQAITVRQRQVKRKFGFGGKFIFPGKSEADPWKP